MTPALARIKRKVRQAIELSGNIDGAAATAERKRSVVGDWHNLAHPAFPSLDRALALDEVAISRGAVPPILAGYAAELGHVAFRLPELPGAADGPAEIGRALIEASAEFGDVAGEVRDATRDGNVCVGDGKRIVAAIDQALVALVRMRALVADTS